ncbi:MAG: DHHW family protein [Eubacteriales bacterium]
MKSISTIRSIATASVFCLFVAFFGIAAWLSPDRDYSVYERRQLQQTPVLAESETLSDYFSAWDTYLSDQFYLRDELRFLKSSFAYRILRQTDVNGYYSQDGSRAELLYPMNDANIAANVALLEEIRQTYFPNSPAYFAVIPDKSYYMDVPLGLNYDEIEEIFTDGLNAASIPLRDKLVLSDYYATDIHWKQENLESVYEALRIALDGDLPPFKEAGFSRQTAGEFYGVLYGQAALPTDRDVMHYLTNEVIEDLTLSVLDTGKTGGVYDIEAFAGDDAYDLYLGGEAALLHIRNPNATTERKLILFRDSFGRSIAPLLAEGYAEIVLVDLRWIRPAYLSNFSDLLSADESTDILFLYSAQVLNSMKLG